MSLAVAPRSYTSASAEYFNFREVEDLGHCWPLLDDHMMQSVMHLHCKGLAPWSIQGRMAVLAFYAKVQGFKY